MNAIDYTVNECKNHMRGLSTDALVEVFQAILKERGYDDIEEVQLFREMDLAYE